ncbi:MAG: FAD-binding protein [Chloroflexota bacterium]|nr:FAD-binding protein [Chloroflexota bacterium]
MSEITRREFIKGAAVTTAAVAGASALAGCAPAPAPAPGIPEKWDKEVDVVVVGTGHAGLATAIAAHDAGAEVLVLEKMPKEFEGGNSKVSGNMWWTPTNVPEAVEYIDAMSYGLTDRESIQALAEEMIQINDWLQEFGIEPTSLSPLFEPEHPDLPGSGSVRTWSNGGMAAIAQGGGLWAPIREAVEDREIQVMYETPAKELVQNAAREIIGVIAESGGNDIAIKSKKAVVLACGGFEFDFEIQSQFLPGWPIYSRGTPGNTGDGIKMAQKAGAALWHMNNALGDLGAIVVPEFEPVPIPIGFPTNGFIFVNKLGRRFMNENRESRHGFGHKEYLMQFDGIEGDFLSLPCYAIFDETTRLAGPLLGMAGWRFGWFNWYSGYEWSQDNSAEIEKGWIKKADNVGALATQLGMEPAELEETISTYNGYCEAQVDPDFGRPEIAPALLGPPMPALVPLVAPPYYAVELYPNMYNTQGGPRRNGKCEIVDPYGEPIPRLYSAGELGSFWGWMYNGGGNNCECLCTGRIAGGNAAAEDPWG